MAHASAPAFDLPIAAAPHRLLFFVGAANVLAAMAWWTGWMAGFAPQPSVPAGWMHAFVMQYQVLPAFIFGFLLTVFPRWMAQTEASKWHYLPVGLGLVAGQALVLAGLGTGSAMLVHLGVINTIAGWVTAMVVLDAKLPMDEMLTMTIANNPEMKGVYSRVRLGSQLDRRETLLITLMSSENRAAATLAHHYPGGYAAFIKAMNAKAKALGMSHTRYVEPTGLSSKNQSSARDLATLVGVAHGDALLREYSTSTGYQVAVGNRVVQCAEEVLGIVGELKTSCLS